MFTRKLFVLLALFVVLGVFAPVQKVEAQSVAYASIAMYVRCASGALPSIGSYQGTWQKDDFSQFLHDLTYDGVFGGYRGYSYVMLVEGNRNWRVKVTSTGGYDTGWSGWKYVNNGYSIGFVYYRTVSC